MLEHRWGIFSCAAIRWSFLISYSNRYVLREDIAVWVELIAIKGEKICTETEWIDVWEWCLWNCCILSQSDADIWRQWWIYCVLWFQVEKDCQSDLMEEIDRGGEGIDGIRKRKRRITTNRWFAIRKGWR